MSDTEHENAPPAGDEAPPQVEPIAPPDVPEGETFEPNTPPSDDDHAEQSDEDAGVGVAPTEPGDAGEGNPGTHFQSTAEIEGEDGQGLADKVGA